MSRTNCLLLLLLCSPFFVEAQPVIPADSTIARYFTRGAEMHSIFSPEWGAWIDKGLKENPRIGYLWQMRAMPYFKQRKYEAGMAYLNKGVECDTTLLPYRAFIKCIFAKTYNAALEDLTICRKKWGNSSVMDHGFDFYIALCHLQLNRPQEALVLLQKQTDPNGPSQHQLELFYLGIAHYELQQYAAAISAFDRSLKVYPRFSDAKYFKGKCLLLSGRDEEAIPLIREAKQDFTDGYTINEDNSVYEPYPYQVNWKMVHIR
ncbi:tetratricopeptide repeat protein [Nostoc ellipsosporum NOK]|nr:tetratricopeptide repeat protein [Nostoc ellipsosporum NOK]